MKRLLTIFLLTLSIGAAGQTLTLEDAVRIAQDSTASAYRNRNASLASKYQYEEFLSSLKPQISFILNPGYQKFTNEPFTHYYKLRNYNMLNTFGEVRLEQKFTGLGGNFYASTGTLWTEYFGENPSDRIFSSIPIGVGYTNDLLGYNPHKWEKQIWDYHSESEKLRFRHEMHRIAQKAEGCFIDCLIAESNYEICLSNASVTRKMCEIGKEKYELASITKNELFSLQLQQVNAENALYNATQKLKDARESLSSCLQKDISAYELVTPVQPDYLPIELGRAIELAKSNNPDYRSTRESVLIAQSDEDRARAESALFRTGLDVNVGLQNNAGTFGGSYADQKLYFTGGVTLKIPIYDGGAARNKRKAASYNVERAKSASEEQERQLATDVTIALKDFLAQQDLLIRTKSALNLADESFQLASELYGNGEIDINSFILTLERKDEAHHNYLLSLKDYWDSLYLLEALCVTSFRE